MYRIIDNRDSGKTSRLMLLAKENSGIIVCKNPAVMNEKARRYGIIGIDFISYEEFLELSFKKETPIFIDEIEDFIKFLTPTLKGYTLTKED